MSYYEIIVETYIDEKRLREFKGLELTHLEDGRTLLSGSLKDQAELFSVISRIRDLNLTLVLIRKDHEEVEKGGVQQWSRN